MLFPTFCGSVAFVTGRSRVAALTPDGNAFSYDLAVPMRPPYYRAECVGDDALLVSGERVSAVVPLG